MMVVKCSLSGSFLLLLLSRTVSGLGSVVSRHYSYYKIHYTWQQAQSYCRNSDDQRDLAIIYTQSDIHDNDLSGYHAWIGLHTEADWTWSDGQYLNLNAWTNFEPDYYQRCSYVCYEQQKIRSADCEEHFFFICGKSTFINESKTWNEATEYCQDKDLSLARYSGLTELGNYVKQQDFPIWIGLHRDGVTWKWSAGFSNYTDWTPGQPGDNSDCVSISSVSKKMATQNCSTRFPFICYKDNLVLVKENKTWEEALGHCRALRSPTQQHLRFDLLSVQPEDYKHVMNMVIEASTEEVWTGLRFLAGQWLWVNGADMLYSDLPLCPPMVQRCGILSKNGTGSMETGDCAEKRNFLCYSKWAS